MGEKNVHSDRELLNMLNYYLDSNIPIIKNETIVLRNSSKFKHYWESIDYLLYYFNYQNKYYFIGSKHALDELFEDDKYTKRFGSGIIIDADVDCRYIVMFNIYNGFEVDEHGFIRDYDLYTELRNRICRERLEYLENGKVFKKSLHHHDPKLIDSIWKYFISTTLPFSKCIMFGDLIRMDCNVLDYLAGRLVISQDVKSDLDYILKGSKLC